MAKPSSSTGHVSSGIDSNLAVSCFRSNREALLIIKHCLQTLTNSLYAKSLITDEVYEKACNENLGKTERAKAILDCLEDKFRGNSSNFTKAIDAFKSDPFLDSLVDKLLQWCKAAQNNED